MSKKYKAWTAEEIELLKSLINKGESSIKNRLMKMGVDIWNENSYQAYVC